MPTIGLTNVTKFYKNDGRWEAAVEGINLTIRQGEFVFLTGSSGAGKSTLLGLMAGNISPDRGRVRLGDKDISRVPVWSRHRVARAFGQVWQEPTLIRRRTIEENLEIAALAGSASRSTPKRLVQLRARKVLGLVGLYHVEHKYPAELSCGEVRRVELARALINSPPILLLDEITANLDDDNIWDMFHLLAEINRRGTTIVIATHAKQYVNLMCRRVITLVDGQIFGDVPRGRYGEVM